MPLTPSVRDAMLGAVPSLRAFAISLAGNVDRADDLVQETLLRAVANIESFQPGSQSNLLMGSPFRFRRHGDCGMDFCELLPCLGSVADELCMVRSMVSESVDHEAALRVIHSGKVFAGRPSWCSWALYGLGSLRQDLPAYVVLSDPGGIPVTAPWR